MRRDPVDIVNPASLEQEREPWDDLGSERVIKILEPLAGERRQTRLKDVIGARIGSVTLMMDAPHDPHNAAAVLRSCDAFGVPQVHIVPRNETFAAGRHVAKGAERWVEVLTHESPEQAARELRARGFELVATHPEGLLVPESLADIPKLCLILGNEHDGIREELMQLATRTVRVPMRGFVESLNLSVAAALLLRAATQNRPGDLSEAERLRLYARGLVHSVPRALEILAEFGRS